MNIKKAAAFFLAAGMLLTFAACGENAGSGTFGSDQSPGQYDSDQNWTHIGTGTEFYKAGNTVYFGTRYLFGVNENGIHYADTLSGISGFLCGKPECRHGGATCNAYLPSDNCEGLSCYDGHLYWVGRDNAGNCHVYRSAPDGTDRETVRKLDKELFLKPGGYRNVLFHRGYVFLCGQTNQVSDGVPFWGGLVYAAPLSGDGEDTVILDKTCDDPALKCNYAMQAWGGGLYIMEYTWKDSVYTLTLYRWDTATQALSTLFTGEIPFTPWEMRVREDGVYFSTSSDGKIYRYSFESKEITLSGDMNANGGDFSMPILGDDRVISFSAPDGEIPVLRVTDFRGTVLYDGEMTVPPAGDGLRAFSVCGADQTDLYLMALFGIGSENGSAELIAVSLTTGEYRSLWSSKENP